MTNYAEFHRRSIEDRDAFWRDEAALIDWQTPFETVLDHSQPPFSRWFVGGRTNLCHNAVDRHLAQRAEQPALIFISTETDRTAQYTYRQLHDEVNCVAAMLKASGVGRGDRVLIYMPMIEEAVFAMLACARIGAVHSVVFGGFAAASLATRIDDARPVLLVTADAGMRSGKVIPYKPLVDEALRIARHPPRRVIIVNRGLDRDLDMQRGRDVDYATLRAAHAGARVPCEWMESSAPSYILFTSGTTGLPKGVQRDTGGYAVALASSLATDLLPGSRRADVLHERHRLGGGPFVHRLRTADQRLANDHVRRAAHPPRCGHLVEDRRTAQGEDDVQLADGDPRSEKAGRRVHAPPRPLVAALPVPRR
jgi:propionyl-CoA synthetase